MRDKVHQSSSFHGPRQARDEAAAGALRMTLGSLSNTVIRIFSMVLVLAAMTSQAFAHGAWLGLPKLSYSPATKAKVIDNYTNGLKPIQNNDVIEIIAELPAIVAGTLSGAQGYITFYIPNGTQVVDAIFVDPSLNLIPVRDGTASNGDGTPRGWGGSGMKTFVTGPTGWNPQPLPPECTSPMYPGNGPYDASNCTSGFAFTVGDTGLFYSTDPDTAMYTGDGTTTTTGLNGYRVNPSSNAPWTSIGGLGDARVHNKWDAVQSNGFGSTAPLFNPGFSGYENVAIQGGRGPAPFGAASPVAGPDSGPKLDRSGTVGPWRRVSHPGSCIAIDPVNNGPANGFASVEPELPSALPSSVAVCTPTAAGVPRTAIPTNANALRFSIGGIYLNELYRVKVSLRVTDATQLESFNFAGSGGDSAEGGSTTKDNPWRYWVGAPANIPAPGQEFDVVLSKTIISVNGLPYDGSSLIPKDAVVTYSIKYANLGPSPHTNMILRDVVPAGTTSIQNITVIDGPDVIPVVSPTTSSFDFQTVGVFPTGGTGEVQLDIVSSAAPETTITNTATLSSDQLPIPIESSVSAVVAPEGDGLILEKTITKIDGVEVDYVPGMQVRRDAEVEYQIRYANTSTINAVYENVVLTDIVPAGTTAISAPVITSDTGTPVVTVNGTPSNTNFDFNPFDLYPGQGGTITYTIRSNAASPDGTALLENTIQMTANQLSTPLTSTTTATIIEGLGLILEKIITKINGVDVTYTPGMEIPRGAEVEYQVRYQNTSTVASYSNVVLTDFVPLGTTAISEPVITSDTGTPVVTVNGTPSNTNFDFNPFTLGPGEGGTITYSITTNTASPDGTTVQTNTIELAADQLTNPITSSATGTIVESVGLILEKIITKINGVDVTYTPGMEIPRGAEVEYQVRYQNTSTVASYSNVVLTDFVPLGTTAISEPVITSDTGTPVVTVNGTPSNTNFDFNPFTLGPGEGGTITYSITTNTASPDGTTVQTNTIELAADQLTNPITSSATGTIVEGQGLELTKTIVSINGLPYTGGDIPRNSTIEYAITFANTGTSTYTNVVFTDILPNNTTGVSGLTTSGTPTLVLAAPPTNDSFSFLPVTLAPGNAGSINYTITNSIGDGRTLTNTISLAAAELSSPLEAQVSVFVKDSNAALQGLRHEKNVYLVNGQPYGGGLIPIGATITYRIEYENIGYLTYTSVQILDKWPAGSVKVSNIFNVFDPLPGPSGANFLPTPTPTGVYCDDFTGTPIACPGTSLLLTIPSLAPGQGGYIQFDMESSASVGQTIKNESQFKSDQINNNNVAEYGVGDIIYDISVAKSVAMYDPLNEGLAAIPGNDVIYTTNIGGPLDADSVVITDPVPADLTFYRSPVDGVTLEPIEFVDGAVASGLLCCDNTHISYSTAGAAGPYNYIAPGPAGTYDPAITHLRVVPTGIFTGVTNGLTASFEIRFRARIK